MKNTQKYITKIELEADKALTVILERDWVTLKDGKLRGFTISGRKLELYIGNSSIEELTVDNYNDHILVNNLETKIKPRILNAVKAAFRKSILPTVIMTVECEKQRSCFVSELCELGTVITDNYSEEDIFLDDPKQVVKTQLRRLVA